MLAEALAVVGSEDQERLFGPAQPLEAVVEAADQLVGPGDLPGVGALRQAAGEWLRRLIGLVRVVEMQPEERARAGGLGLEPGERLIECLVAAPLGPFKLPILRKLRIPSFPRSPNGKCTIC